MYDCQQVYVAQEWELLQGPNAAKRKEHHTHTHRGGRERGLEVEGTPPPKWQVRPAKTEGPHGPSVFVGQCQYITDNLTKTEF